MTILYNIIIRSFINLFFIGVIVFLQSESVYGQVENDRYLEKEAYLSGQRKDLENILQWLSPDATQRGTVSYRDSTFTDWLKRTKELPPKFEEMPSIPFLPNPLIIDEGGENIKVENRSLWDTQKENIKDQLQHYITGTIPPAPSNLKAEILDEKKDGDVVIKTVMLSFGPDNQAKMTVELMIPPSEESLPVFLTQWNHRDWAALAVRRGYIGCIYAGADIKDDTHNYAEIWNGEYDFTRIMARAYGASRVIDYLYTLPIVHKEKIGISGHSRNGKQSLWAAAFDERIGAAITSSGGSGGELPWRYSRHKYGDEDIGLLSAAQPSWLHPRLRFFIGRENKLPIDQNSFMALVAPRGLMLSSSRRESDGNHWGIERAFDSALEVYDFLDHPENIAVRLRDGKHGTSAKDIEEYIDFFDFVFGNSKMKPENKRYFNYSFSDWKRASGEELDLHDFPVIEGEAVLNNKEGVSKQRWKQEKEKIIQNIQWLLGEEPPGVTNSGPLNYSRGETTGEEYFGNMIPRPDETKEMGRLALGPVGGKPGFGEGLYGYLYYPKDQEMLMKSGLTELPVIIFPHKYDYSNGFYDTQGFDHNKMPFLKKMTAQGYAVFLYDMMGFGNRIEEGVSFYQRYPKWSLMGKHVVDLKNAVTALSNLDFVNANAISVLGYSLGATVGLYAAALDSRISSVVTISGFTPMRMDTPDKGTEGIKAYSHLHGLIPRLGFFEDNENRIPIDFNEIIASIAPRSVLVVAPKYDQDATLEDIRHSVNDAQKIYQIYGETRNLQLIEPNDYSRFSYHMQDSVLEWYKNRLENGVVTSSIWEDLLHGKLKDSWVIDQNTNEPDSVWEMSEGVLSLKNRDKKGNLMTKNRFGNFELIFDFNYSDKANSGIKYLVTKVKNKTSGREAWNGFEYQIIDDYQHPAVAGNLTSNASTAGQYLLYEPKDKILFPSGQWNRGKIVVYGNHVEHWLNGKKVLEMTRDGESYREKISQTKFKDYEGYGEEKEGRIQIQNHQGDKVYYRNIKIKSLE